MINRLDRWANERLDRALRCPECDHKEFEMDCTCGDDLCLCFIQATETKLDQQEWENDRGLE